jgi:hypothetical protein
MDSFWDMASWKHPEDKLQNLTWIPGDVDTFVAQFCTLADQAEYPLDDCPTITLFASKLPFEMMEHIFCNVRPPDFQGWADAARDYHQSNMAIQGLQNTYEDNPKKFSGKEGMMAQQWAQILGVKLPSALDPNAMDTHANRSCSFYRNKTKGSKGHSTTTEEDIETLCNEGQCYSCKKQGHLAQNCPAKPKTFNKGKAKACTAEAKASDAEDNSDSLDDEKTLKAFVKRGREMSEEKKLSLLSYIAKGEQEGSAGDQDF